MIGFFYICFGNMTEICFLVNAIIEGYLSKYILNRYTELVEGSYIMDNLFFLSIPLFLMTYQNDKVHILDERTMMQ